MLFQNALTKFFKSELFSCLQKVDQVFNYCKRPVKVPSVITFGAKRNKYRILHGKCGRTVFTHELLTYQNLLVEFHESQDLQRRSTFKIVSYALLKCRVKHMTLLNSYSLKKEKNTIENFLKSEITRILMFLQQNSLP